MATEQWFWMMNYCKRENIPPAQSWAWEEAKKAYDAMMSQHIKLGVSNEWYSMERWFMG